MQYANGEVHKLFTLASAYLKSGVELGEQVKSYDIQRKRYYQHEDLTLPQVRARKHTYI